MQRSAIYVLILGIAVSRIDIKAQQVRVITDVRAELHLEQSAGMGVMIELNDGSHISGVVDRLDTYGFEIDGRSVSYSSVAAFLDPVTEQPIVRVRQSSPMKAPRPATRQYSTKTVVIVAVAVAVFLIWVRLSTPYT